MVKIFFNLRDFSCNLPAFLTVQIKRVKMLKKPVLCRKYLCHNIFLTLIVRQLIVRRVLKT